MNATAITWRVCMPGEMAHYAPDKSDKEAALKLARAASATDERGRAASVWERDLRGDSRCVARFERGKEVRIKS